MQKLNRICGLSRANIMCSMGLPSRRPMSDGGRDEWVEMNGLK